MLDFSIQEAAKNLVSRERYQRGSIQKVGKRRKAWKLHWHVYLIQPDGSEKRRHRSKALDCEQYSKADAWRKLDEIIAKECGGQSRPDNGITVEEFYRTIFLPTRSWSGHTAKNAEYRWEKYIRPFFGSMRVGDVRRHHIDRFYQGAAGLGASTLAQIRSSLHGIFGYAVENGYIEKLAMPKLKISKIAKAEDGETRVLTFEEAGRVCHMRGEHGLAYRVLMYCGLRIGELLALRWDDIHETTITVDESVESGSAIKSTKSGETRQVPLPSDLRSELMARRGPIDQDDWFVFGLDGNRAKWASSMTARRRYMYPARVESGIGWLDFHCVRRTCATLLKDRGYAQTADIQAILGHSEPATTERHYIKPVAESQQRAINQLFKDLSGAVQ